MGKSLSVSDHCPDPLGKPPEADPVKQMTRATVSHPGSSEILAECICPHVGGEVPISAPSPALE